MRPFSLLVFFVTTRNLFLYQDIIVTSLYFLLRPLRVYLLCLGQRSLQIIFYVYGSRYQQIYFSPFYIDYQLFQHQFLNTIPSELLRHICGGGRPTINYIDLFWTFYYYIDTFVYLQTIHNYNILYQCQSSNQILFFQNFELVCHFMGRSDKLIFTP